MNKPLARLSAVLFSLVLFLFGIFFAPFLVLGNAAHVKHALQQSGVYTVATSAATSKAQTGGRAG